MGTRKEKDKTMQVLQDLVKKYHVTRSGSKRAIAQRLQKYSAHVMLLAELKFVEDFLRLPPSTRFKGSRYYTRKNGSLYCAGGICPED